MDRWIEGWGCLFRDDGLKREQRSVRLSRWLAGMDGWMESEKRKAQSGEHSRVCRLGGQIAGREKAAGGIEYIETREWRWR